LRGLPLIVDPSTWSADILSGNVNDFFDGPFQYEVGLAQGRARFLPPSLFLSH